MEYNYMIPPFLPKDFISMNKREAQEYFEWFVGQVEIRIEYLQWYLQSESSDIILDYSVESLISLWKWYEERILVTKKELAEREEELSKYPEWVQPNISDYVISMETLKVAMDISIYFAEVIRRKHSEKIKWGYYVKPKNRDAVNRPVLLGFVNGIDLCPTMIINSCTRRSTKQKDDKRLYNLYYVWEKYIPN